MYRPILWTLHNIRLLFKIGSLTLVQICEPTNRGGGPGAAAGARTQPRSRPRTRKRVRSIHTQAALTEARRPPLARADAIAQKSETSSQTSNLRGNRSGAAAEGAAAAPRSAVSELWQCAGSALRSATSAARSAAGL